MSIEYIYLGFCLLGGLGLLISLFSGTDLDHDGLDHDISTDSGLDGDSGPDSPKLFSLRVIFAFLLSFGIGAGSLWLLNTSIAWQLIVGFIAGLITGLSVFYAFKALYSLQGNSSVSADSFIGKTAIVTVDTANNGSCQVDVDSDTGDTLFIAKEINSTPVKKSDIVHIVGRAGNVLIVEKQ